MKNCPVVNFWDDYKSRAKLAQNRNRLFAVFYVLNHATAIKGRKRIAKLRLKLTSRNVSFLRQAQDRLVEGLRVTDASATFASERVLKVSISDLGGLVRAFSKAKTTVLRPSRRDKSLFETSEV